MQPADWLGWGASAVLLATLLRQVWKEWHERSTTGLSSWLFVGQITASLGFVIYSWLVDNRVFVVTNTAILLTAIAGQLIYRRNVRLAADEGAGAGRGNATAAEPPG